MSTAVAMTLDDALESETFKAIARAGSIEHDELAYQLEKKGTAIADQEVDALAEAGLITVTGDLYAVVIPEPRERAGGGKGGGGGNGYTHDEILLRVRLWAVITGRPPAQKQWHISEVRKQAGRLRTRLDYHERAIGLYEAGDWPATTTVVNRFGSFNAALVAAGFEARGPGQQPGVPVVPGHPWRPMWGEGPLEEAFERSREARAAEDDDALREALLEVAIAAFNEADRIGEESWDPEAHLA